ncbi:LysR family transcriptional regulator [Rhizobium sp. LjRoot258]|uniref:LysR family transcriptional regulator n=1 Tax=Rhizobium sp. LjRoot258 TaxID=3342299 RepID=UPI003ECD1F33
MDNFGALGIFIQAAELRSFARTGQQFGISSSAVGKTIARLEDRLGVRLFHRSTRSITLTPEGAMFLERCRRIAGEIEAAELELARTKAAPRGKLRVSLPLAGMLFMPTITAFMQSYREIELDLDFTDRLVDVIEEGFDAVVRTGEISDSRLMTRTLGKFSHRIVGSSEYLARMGVPTAPKDLRRHFCLHHKYPSSGKLERWPFRTDGPLDLPVSSIASTLEPLIYMAESGIGLACLPLFTVREQLRSGRLLSVMEEELADVGAFRILWPANRYPAPKIQVFVDYMARHLFS